MAKNDSVFPSMEKILIFNDEMDKHAERVFPIGGLTKLEWFAGMAKLSDVEMFYGGADTNYREEVQRAWVRARFDFAEAMIAESEKRNGNE